MDHRPWTLLIYMAGDNNLDQAAVEDVRELLQHGSGTRARIVVQLDRMRGPTRRYVIPDDAGVSFDEATRDAHVIPETNTGDPKDLTAFIAWGKKTFPSDRLGLVIWNHGGGWRPLDIERVGRTALPKDTTVAPLFPNDHPRRGTFRTLLPHRHSLFLHPRAIADTHEFSAYIAVDEGAPRMDALDTVELRKALQDTLSATPLDFLGFDACLMAQLEIAYELRNLAHVIVGSEATEPGEGWPYNAITPLFSHGAPDADQLAEGIAKAYIGWCHAMEEEGLEDNNTQAVLRVPAIAALAKSTGIFAQTLTDAIADHALLVRAICDDVQRYEGEDGYADLGHLAKLARKHVPATAVAKASEALLEDLKKAVAYHGQVGDDVTQSTGLTIYLPRTAADLRRYRKWYGELAFAQDHPQWLLFLETCFGQQHRLTA